LLPSLRRALGLAVIATALAPTGALAAITETTITTPASPAYRLYQPSVKAAAETLSVAGSTDGAAGDMIDFVCDGTPIRRAVAVDKEGVFAVELPYKAFPRLLCTLRAVPNKLNGKDLDPFTGPLVAVTYFNPYETTTEVLGADRPVPMNYNAQTAHRGGPTDLHAIGGGALQQSVWTLGARVGTEAKDDRNALEVDGRAAYSAADVPLYRFEGERPAAPAGFDGVQATLTLDERTGGVVVVESQRIVRCAGTDAPRPPQEFCREVLGTGVRLERTITFTDEHRLVDVQDRWIATDGQPHRLRAVYSNGVKAERPLWRLAGEAAFRPREYPDAVVPSGPGSLLLDTGAGMFGALSYDPAPSVFAFGGPGLLAELVEATVPAGGMLPVRRSFASGDNVIAVEQLVGRFAPRPEPTATPVPENGPPQHVIDDRHRPDDGGVRRCTVPRVRAGATVKSARSALKKAGCKTARSTRKARSAKVRKGRVVSLSRKAGASVPIDAAITIKVSSGRKRS
jgi:hypothetical protein